MANIKHPAPVPADHPFAIRHAELTTEHRAMVTEIRASYGLTGYLAETAIPAAETEVDAANAKFAALIADARAQLLG